MSFLGSFRKWLFSRERLHRHYLEDPTWHQILERVKKLERKLTRAKSTPTRPGKKP